MEKGVKENGTPKCLINFTSNQRKKGEKNLNVETATLRCGEKQTQKELTRMQVYGKNVQTVLCLRKLAK